MNHSRCPRERHGVGPPAPSGQFRAWLITIARRLVVDHYRREKIEWEQESEAIEAVATPGALEQGAETPELLARTERALDELPPPQRELILLSRLAGMNADETPRVIDSTPGAVRVAIHRALRRLRSLIEKGT